MDQGSSWERRNLTKLNNGLAQARWPGDWQASLRIARSTLRREAQRMSRARIIHSTAVHEAAHAVIAGVLGFECSHVTIVPGLANGSLGRAAIASPQRDRNDGVPQLVRAQVIISLAGREAEEELVGAGIGARNGIYGDHLDRARARMYLRELVYPLANPKCRGEWELREAEVERLMDRFRDECRCFIRRYRVSIEDFAAELEKEHSLSGRYLAALLAQATGSRN